MLGAFNYSTCMQIYLSLYFSHVLYTYMYQSLCSLHHFLIYWMFSIYKLLHIYAVQLCCAIRVCILFNQCPQAFTFIYSYILCIYNTCLWKWSFWSQVFEMNYFYLLRERSYRIISFITSFSYLRNYPSHKRSWVFMPRQHYSKKKKKQPTTFKPLLCNCSG